MTIVLAAGFMTLQEESSSVLCALVKNKKNFNLTIVFPYSFKVKKENP